MFVALSREECYAEINMKSEHQYAAIFTAVPSTLPIKAHQSNKSRYKTFIFQARTDRIISSCKPSDIHQSPILLF